MKKIVSLFSVIFILLVFMCPITPITVNAEELAVEVNESEITEKGWLAAEATVPENFVSDVYVSVADKDGNEYQLMLYAVNDYLDRKELPVGEYVITGAGVMHDLTNKFPITYKNKSDTVTVAAKTSATLIQIEVSPSEEAETISEPNEPTTSSKEEITASKGTDEEVGKLDQTEPTTSNTEELADKAIRQLLYSLIATIIVIIISIAGIIIYKKKRG